MSFSTSSREVIYSFKKENKFGRNDISYDTYFNMLEPFFITSFETLAENL